LVAGGSDVAAGSPEVKDSDFGWAEEGLKISVGEALESLMVPAWMAKVRDSEGCWKVHWVGRRCRCSHDVCRIRVAGGCETEANMWSVVTG
jgi:hypothetical protein